MPFNLWKPTASIPCIVVMFSMLFASTGGQAETPVIQDTSTVKDLMIGLTIPASDYIWGVEDAPQDDAGWKGIKTNADLLAKSGTLLLSEGRARDGEAWSRESNALISAAGMAGKAADAKNFDLLMEAGEAIYNSCESCHTEYQQR